MGTSKKRKKVKRRKGRVRSNEAPAEREEEGGSSGLMGNMRSGFKGAVGVGDKKKKESALSKALTYLLLATAVGVLIYRFVLN